MSSLTLRRNREILTKLRAKLLPLGVGAAVLAGGAGITAAIVASIPPDYTGPAVVQSKDYDPAWTQVTTTGKTTTVTHHPESWDLELCAIIPDNGRESRECWWVSVDPGLYERTLEGSPLNVTKGRP